MDNELNRFEKQLLQMDEKLERARKVRDDYIDMLSKKYPQWRPPFFSLKEQAQMANDHPAPILDSMVTGRYYWDISRTNQTRPHAIFEDHTPADPIPSSGPALDTDLARIKKRLEEISDDLYQLRSHRIYLSSVDFFQSLDPTVWGPSDQQCYIEKSPSQDDHLKKVYDLRRRIENIDISSISKTPSPMGASEAALREEFLMQKYGEPGTQTSFSKETCSNSKHLQEAEALLPNAVTVPLAENAVVEGTIDEKMPPGRTDVKRILSTVQPSGNIGEASLFESKLHTRESKVNIVTPTAEHKTESSGESFLSKILGNGPRESTDSSEDAMRLHEKHESDSDSDFFA